MSTGFVYVIHNGAGFYKIGFTHNPRKRLTMLRTSSPDKLTLLGVVPATMEQEKELHRLLAPSRVVREWFRISKAMQPLLDGLRPVLTRRMARGSETPNPLLTYRVINDLSQQTLADALGVTRVDLSRWESGVRQVPAHRCAHIESVIGVTCSALRPDVFPQQAAA